MADLRPYVAVITWTINDLTMPIKREISREDYKTTQLYGVHKKLNSNITVQTGWK